MPQDDHLVVTRSRLMTDLDRLGVRPGQVVMLHASVKEIGWVVGGPEIVLQSLLDLLTPSGTLMMMVSWEDHPYELNSWSAEKQQQYLAELPTFDPQTARADHRELSILTEYLRTQPGAVRSRHPLSSFAAIGAKANWLMENHPYQYGCGPGSPLAKLHELGGKVLSLGAPFETLTLLHYAEHLVNITDKKIVRYKMPVLVAGQREWVELEEYDTDNGIVEWPGEDYFKLIVQDYLKAGQGNTGKVGQAASYLIEAQDVSAFGVSWMERNFRPV